MERVIKNLQVLQFNGGNYADPIESVAVLQALWFETFGVVFNQYKFDALSITINGVTTPLGMLVFDPVADPQCVALRAIIDPIIQAVYPQAVFSTGTQSFVGSLPSGSPNFSSNYLIYTSIPSNATITMTFNRTNIFTGITEEVVVAFQFFNARSQKTFLVESPYGNNLVDLKGIGFFTCAIGAFMHFWIPLVGDVTDATQWDSTLASLGDFGQDPVVVNVLSPSQCEVIIKNSIIIPQVLTFVDNVAGLEFTIVGT